MKKLITLLLLFTLIGFLSGNQVVITNNYEYIITTEATYNFSNGTESNNVKYDRTNKIAIQNNKVIANPLNYHYAFFWDEANAFIGYYKTNKGIATNGAYLGQVNTQSIPLPLNAYSFALVRYDNDYILVNGFTIEDLFIDNNLAVVDPDDFNDIPIAELNNNSLNDIFNRTILKTITQVGNGVKYYEISGGNIVQRIQERTLLSSDINIFLTSTTNFDSAFTIDLRPLGLLNGTSAINGQTYVEGYMPETISSIPDILGNEFKHRLGSDGRIQVSFPKGTYANLAAAQAGLAGTQILYQLETPITILSDVSIDQTALDTYYQIWLNGVNATYYATDGNVSTLDGYYYAAGKNLFKTDIEQGSISDSTGLNISSGISARTIDFIPVKSPISLRQVSPTYFFVRAYFYDVNKNIISATTYNTGSNVNNISLPSGTNYLKLVYRRSDATSFTLSDITALKSILQLEGATSATTFEAYAQPTTTLNLTFLFGIGNEPNKATMDGYYQDYEDWQDYSFILPLAFNTQTLSFETIYFDDGVSTEIERLGSILIFTLIGFTLMIFGFASKRRIFNLLSIGAFIVLGVLLAEFAGFLIIVFGLVVLNLYYTFLGDI
jgi:hypothetical protein